MSFVLVFERFKRGCRGERSGDGTASRPEEMEGEGLEEDELGGDERGEDRISMTSELKLEGDKRVVIWGSDEYTHVPRRRTLTRLASEVQYF